MKQLPPNVMKIAGVQLTRAVAFLLSGLFGLLIISAVALTIPKVNLWLLNKLIESTPGLDVEQVSGNVLGELAMRGIDYRSDDMRLHVAQMNSQFALPAVLYGVLRFDSLEIVGVHYRHKDNANQQQDDTDVAFFLPLRLEIDRLAVKDVRYQTAEQDYRVQQVTAAMRWSGNQVEVPRVSVQLQAIQVNAAGDISLSKQLPFHLELAVIGEYQQIGSISTRLQLHGNKQKIDLQMQTAAPVVMQASGSLLLDKQQPEMQLRGNWQDLHWPLQGKADFTSGQGKFSLTGPVDDYRVGVSGDLTATDTATATIDLSAHGNTKWLRVTDSTIKTLGGIITARGKFDWSQYNEWLFDINARDLQLQQLQRGRRGSLSVQTQLSGNTRHGLSVTAHLQNVSGRVEGYPVNGQGDIRYLSDSIHVDRLAFNVGQNKLSAHGVLGEKSDLQFNLHASDLAVFTAGLEGRIKADGKLRGNMHRPHTQLHLTGSAFAYRDYRIERIKLQSNLDFSGAGRFDLSLAGEGLSATGHAVDKLEVHTQGDYTDHHVELLVLSPTGDIRLQTDGSYSEKNKRLHARIKALQLSNTEVGEWGMADTARVDVIFNADKTKIDSSPLCLVSQQQAGRLCFQAVWKNTGRQLFTADADKLPMEMFAFLYPDNMRMEGLLSLKLELQPADELQGRLSLTTDSGVLKYRNEQGNAAQYPFTTELHADLRDNQLESRFSLTTIKQGVLSGKLTVQQVTSLEQATLAGNVSLNFPDLTFLNALQSELTQIGGGLAIEFAFKGPLKNPLLISLNSSVSNVHFSLPAVGVEVTGMHLTAHKKEQQQEYVLSGAAQLGEHTAQLQGSITQSESGGIELRLKLQGEQLKIVQLPEAEIWASPDLTLQADRRGLSLNGGVLLPKATITIEQLPENAVAVSKDEVIVTDTEVKPKQHIFAINTDLKVVLGEDVAIDAYGLTAKLKGELRAVYNKDRLQLFNELNLVDGAYQIYGQDLKIKKGQVVFTGSADNPYVNFLASRTSLDSGKTVTAYLKMTGTLRNPQTTIYTVPSLPDGEALAYLITGRSLKSGGVSSSAILAKAAMFYGKGYIEGVMSTLGIDEFEYKSTSVGENSVVLGKKITPKLSVRYIMDILTGQMVMAVQYKLTKHISIETRSGDTHSSDIKYHIDFD